MHSLKMPLLRSLPALTAALLLAACRAESAPAAPETALPSLVRAEVGNAAPVRQIAAAEDGLYLVDEAGKLFRLGSNGQTEALAEGFAPDVLLGAEEGLAVGGWRDNGGLLRLNAWRAEGHQAYGYFPAAAHAASVWHSGCLIAAAEAGGAAYPVRACPQKETLNIRAERRDITLLPDSRPVLWQGRAAVLGSPDAHSYRHGVLGDGIEAKTLYLLDTQTLRDAAEPFTLPAGLVFENNTVAAYGGKIAAVVSGSGAGARTVVLALQNGRWQIESQSTPLPENRWQSPFVFDGALYAVQMPHLAGRLVRYTAAAGGRLSERELGGGLSNHAMGSRDTNIGAVLPAYALIPQAGYRRLYALDKTGRLHRLEPELPARIVRSAVQGSRSYWLLADSSVWVWRQPETERISGG